MPSSSHPSKNASSSKQPQHPDETSLTSGIPPWHSIAFVGALLAGTIAQLPSLTTLDESATIDQFTKRVFPQTISLRTLAMIRLSIAILALSVTVRLMIGGGWHVYAHYKPYSRLQKNHHIHLQGLGTLCPFTSWCWLFLGLAFLFNGSIALAVDVGRLELLRPWILRTALILSEISFPFALLVSTVVKYAIWPAVLAGGKPHRLGCFRNQMQHNCNSIFALGEVVLLGGISVHFHHLSLAALVGIIYILFSWIMAVCYCGNSEIGPQYLYWFLDTTMGPTTTYAMLVLLIVLTSFFGIFAGIEMLIKAIGGTLITKLAFVAVLTSVVCRFQ